MADFASVLAVVSTAVAAGGGALALEQIRETRSELRALELIAKEDKRKPAGEVDLASLGSYLFDTLGAMSIRDYARDHEAREFVARAVDRAEEFLEEGKPRPGHRSGQADHLAAALNHMRAGDVVAGLARLRLAVELRLRDLAISRGLPFERAVGGRLIDVLRREDVLDPATAQALAHVVRVANRGVHGESVDAGEAREALNEAERALAALDRTEPLG